MSIDVKKIPKLPDVPGVYFFKDTLGQILYVGKATSLKDRVRSYFTLDISIARGPKIVHMLKESTSIDFIQTDSVLEALILEANLIKKHQPPSNSQEKDNKSFNYVIFTKEAFPRIITMRGRVLFSTFPKENVEYIFGPFPHGTQLREAMKIIRRLFPFRDNKCIPAPDQLKKRPSPYPCFNQQIALCPGVCIGEMNEKEYAQHIKNLKLFFEGKKKEVIVNLQKEMKLFAADKEFERAMRVRQTIFALNHIQDIALLKHTTGVSESIGGEITSRERQNMFRIEAYDVAHFSGKNVVGVMTVVENGEVAQSEYRKFKIKINPGIDDTQALQEIMRRRLGHVEWPLPQLIVVDGAIAQINAARKILKERGFTISVVGVVKDERHKPKEIRGDTENHIKYKRAILLANSEAHRFAIAFHRRRRNSVLY